MEIIQSSDAACPYLSALRPGRDRAKTRRIRDFGNVKNRKKLRIKQGEESASLIPSLRSYRKSHL